MKKAPSLHVVPLTTSPISLAVGTYLTTGGKHFRLELRQPNGWLVRNVESNETKSVTDHRLISDLHDGTLQASREIQFPQSKKFEKSIRTALGTRVESQAALNELVCKKRWIDALESLGHTKIDDSPWIRNAIDRLASGELAGVKRYSITTLRDTANLVRKAGNDWSLAVPNFSERGGRGKHRTDPRTEEIIRVVLEGIKDGKGRIQPKKIFQTISTRIEELNQTNTSDPIPTPGASTVSRRIEASFTAEEISIRNHGLSSTKKTYRENSYPRDSALYPLLVSEYDDIDAGVFLVDDRLRLPSGRAFITHGVCQNTRVALGFDLGHTSRSYESALGAICDSLLPKDSKRIEFEGCTGAWTGYGVQGTILMDNAPQNFSAPSRLAAKQGRLALAGVRPYTPTEKNTIEHYNWIVKSDFCPDLPGWRGDKRDPDSVKQGISDSCLDVTAFKSLYVKWVVDVYSNKPGDDGLTPNQRWHQHFKDHAPAVRWSRDQVALLRLRATFFRFRASGGIKRLNLVYNSDALAELRREIGDDKSVLTFVDRSDLTSVLVQHPHTKNLLRVPCLVDPNYIAGLTTYQQSLILKIARARGIRNPSLAEMVRSREELSARVEKERRSNKLRRRQWSERVGDVPAMAAEEQVEPDAAQGASTPVKKFERVMTDLEWTMLSLEQIELDPQEEWA